MMLFVVALWIVAAALVLVRDWRLTVPLLLLSDVLRAVLVWQIAPATDGRATTLLAELVTAAGVAAILGLSALRFGRGAQAPEADEATPFELRRVRRRATQLERARARRRTLLITVAALVLAGLATALVLRVFPLTGHALLDRAWLFVTVCAVMILITAGDMLKLGIGLLLLLGCAKLLYFGLAAQLVVLHVALWEATSLLLAVLVAALCGLLYGRLRTLSVGGLVDAEP